MKICPKCGVQNDDTALFCEICGAQLAAPAAPNAYPNPHYNPAPYTYADPYDHTAEFDPKDISDNKVISMLVYLMGWIGIVIALLASSHSKYAAFHVRQALKFTVVSILSSLATVCLVLVGALFYMTVIIPIIAAVAALALVIMQIVLGVIQIICFFQICKGKAKEPAIIRSLKFLK